MGSTVEKQADNTLTLLLRQSVLEQSKGLVSGGSVPLAKQERMGAGSAEKKVPKPWKAVTDEATEKTYYWNTLTNETSWSMPEPAAEEAPASEDSLPEGWERKIHSASGQAYFFHQRTGKSSFTLPTLVKHAEIEAVHSAVGDKNPQNQAKTCVAAQKKRRREDVDPLDPTGGRVSYFVV
jgi:hypothetical protein